MTGIAGAGLLAGLPLLSMKKAGARSLTILHTNDTHSRLDPYPMNDPNFPGMGGYARRAALVAALRKSDPGLLLLDAGDIFQGTPYYNMFGGEPELRLMSHMGYDAAAVGNHEFDNGLEAFKEVMAHAKFPFLSANLDFSETVLRNRIQPYMILKRNGIKIGIYGLGIDPRGLVSPSLYGNTRYLDPVETALAMEKQLKEHYSCKLIVCLSHLGYEYQSGQVGDTTVAAATRYTDIIIGGHTHTVLDPAVKVMNSTGKPVCIGQTGSGGVRLGVMQVVFDPENGEKLVETNTIKIFNNQA